MKLQVLSRPHALFNSYKSYMKVFRKNLLNTIDHDIIIYLEMVLATYNSSGYLIGIVVQPSYKSTTTYEQIGFQIKLRCYFNFSLLLSLKYITEQINL